MNVKFPQVEVELTGQDGNAYAILGAVSRAMKRAGIPTRDIEDFFEEAKSGDYDHLLQTTMKTVNVS